MVCGYFIFRETFLEVLKRNTKDTKAKGRNWIKNKEKYIKGNIKKCGYELYFL